MILFSLSDIISLIGVFVNILLAVYLTHFIQRNQINSRTLKDYYIGQIDKVSVDLYKFLDTLDSERIRPQEVQNIFIRLLAQINNISESVLDRYKVDCRLLLADIIVLQQSVENDTTFLRNFRQNRLGFLTNNTINEVRTFRSTKIKSVYSIITSINDYA